MEWNNYSIFLLSWTPFYSTPLLTINPNMLLIVQTCSANEPNTKNQKKLKTRSQPEVFLIKPMGFRVPKPSNTKRDEAFGWAKVNKWKWLLLSPKETVVETRLQENKTAAAVIGPRKAWNFTLVILKWVNASQTPMIINQTCLTAFTSLILYQTWIGWIPFMCMSTQWPPLGSLISIIERNKPKRMQILAFKSIVCHYT